MPVYVVFACDRFVQTLFLISALNEPVFFFCEKQSSHIQKPFVLVKRSYIEIALRTKV